MTLHRTLVADAVTRPKLRPYQQQVRDGVEQNWTTGVQNVLAILPTGGGKTVVFSSVLADEQAASVAVAHRQELVSQISLALARNRVRHRIVGPQNVVKMIVRLHMEEVGASYYDANSRCAVAGVDTLIRRGEQLANWLPTVKLWVMDEAHHVLRDNKWGKAVQMFPNARGLGVTATPCRADGNGLGRHADGVFDTMVIGPTMRDLIDAGFLTEYRIFAPPSTLDMSGARVSKTTGDFNPNDVTKAVAGSSLVVHDEKTVVGDVVRIYQEKFTGKLGVVFTPNINTAEDLAEQFRSVGVPAMCIHANTDVIERQQAIRDFRNRKLMVLTNCGIFSEGFDLPAIEVVQDASPTESYSNFAQRFGRMLRLLDGKKFGIYCDHAGNVMRHGLPDAPREWSLDRRERRSSGKSDAAPVRTCLACTAVFERFMDACPFCGEPIPQPAQRSGPEFVDGDLYELDAATLAQMRSSLERVDMDPSDYRDLLTRQGVPQIGIMANVKRHIARQETVGTLRDILALWGGYERAAGLSDKEIMRKFYLTYGVDLWTAQTLKQDEMLSLAERVQRNIPVPVQPVGARG
ncbi:MAG: DEAD/DEAH box helicase [Plesiomonas shigelloides]